MFSSEHTLDGRPNGAPDHMIRKSRDVHTWRQDIREDYFEARQFDVDHGVSAAEEVINQSPDQFDSDLEEFYPDVLQLYHKSDYMNDAAEHESDDCEIDTEVGHLFSEVF